MCLGSTTAWDGFGALERKGVLNDTMVVFTSDHGISTGSADQRRAASGVRRDDPIPLVIRYPPLAMAGSTPSEIALSLDIAPTLSTSPGLLALKSRPLLVPVLKKEARDILPHRVSPTPFFREFEYGLAVRTSRHKYINYRELQGMDELYDLETDPYEEMNIIDRSDAREALQKMQAELQRLIDQTRYAAPAPTVKPVSP